MIKARAYQDEAVNCVFDWFRRNPTGNPLIAMPTGTGKSVVIALFLYIVFQQWPRQKILVLTHVKELIEQNYKKLIGVWPQAPAGIYSAGLNRRDYMQSIIFAGIASVAKKFDLFGYVDLILVDECHLINPTEATMYQNFIAALCQVNPNLRIIGLTATPYRLGFGKITEDGLFTDIAFDITGLQAFNRLIAEGYLCKLIPKQTATQLDVDGVSMRGGDFVSGQLQAAVNRDSITRAAIEEAMQYQETRHSWLVFCSGVEHAIDVCEMLNEYGIPTATVHSKMSDAERDEAINGFKSGKYKAITNNNVLTTGFDHPPVDMILVLRPTASTVMWVQMLGRGTRPYDCNTPWDVDPVAFPYVKRNCLVLDFSGNSKRLGPINDPVIPRKKGEKGGIAPTKCCEKCNTWVHASARFCDAENEVTGEVCGYEFVFKTKLTQTSADAELIKGDMPVVEVFKVDHVTYNLHLKRDKPDSIKISYFSGLRKFNEFVMPEHDGFANRKTRLWWKEHCPDLPMPLTSAEMLETMQAGKVPFATHLRIWVNKKYPEIMAQCMDGTAFGKEQDTGERPVAEGYADPKPSGIQLPPGINPGDFEDDIPF